MTAHDGDGWVDCACGNKHWGLNGAAGVLIVHRTQILLQHRAPWVHNGDTWGIPGGARNSHETTIESAFREAVEETGIDTSLLTPLHTFTDDHGDWKYETIIAQAAPGLVAHELNDESHEVRWVEITEVHELPLHPSFAKSWPELMKLLNNLIGPT
jgi:8-oxo-dGTP diphosphatase